MNTKVAATARCNVLIVHRHDLGQYPHCCGLKTVESLNLDAFAARLLEEK